jgi:[protein-PII] uridylyltransferase
LTALVECRLIAGNDEMVKSFQAGFLRFVLRNQSKLVRMIIDARLEERQKFGETVYLLHPNVKRSQGCLRDIQLVRWVGFVCYGEPDPEQLVQKGLLMPEDFRSLRIGYQYLLRLRNQLHFDAGRIQDSLDRSQQVRLAATFGFQGKDGLLPVEEFMQEYFERTSEIRYSSAHFVDSSEVGSPALRAVTKLLARPIGKDFWLGLREIWANQRGLEELKVSPVKVLELMTLANQFNCRVEDRTWRAIRTGMLRLAPQPLSDELINKFMTLMEHPSGLARMLRRLHELRVLEQIIPAMKHARYLLQFNEYHKYTVDAHCIRAVEAASEFQKQNSILGETYRAIKPKAILHLALLLHDLGKGFVEDHSEVGKRIAEETAAQLKLTSAQKELLVFLVHQHLLMAHSAFRYDLTEKGTVIQFAAQVGSIEHLEQLFVLTCADLAAVGPGALNDWKMKLIVELFEATAAKFGDNKHATGLKDELQQKREAVLRLFSKKDDLTWYREQVESLPSTYLFQVEPAEVVSELKKLHEVSLIESPMAWGTYHNETEAIQYTVAVKQREPIGLFHRISGALSSQGLQILSAEIHTQPGDIAWDRFLVADNDYLGPPPPSRITSVCEKIIQAITPAKAIPPTFRRVWQVRSGSEDAIRIQPTQVRFDNSTSDRFTIISVFAYDRLGLLYDIAKAIYDARLILHIAKISTHLDQIVDVFYVTDLDGKKVVIPTRLYTIRQLLLRAIETK